MNYFLGFKVLLLVYTKNVIGPYHHLKFLLPPTSKFFTPPSSLFLSPPSCAPNLLHPHCPTSFIHQNTRDFPPFSFSFHLKTLPFPKTHETLPFPSPSPQLSHFNALLCNGIFLQIYVQQNCDSIVDNVIMESWFCYIFLGFECHNEIRIPLCVSLKHKRIVISLCVMLKHTMNIVHSNPVKMFF